MSWISTEFFLNRVVCLLNTSTSLDAWLAARTHLVARVTASSSKQGRDFKIARKDWIPVVSIRERQHFQPE